MSNGIGNFDIKWHLTFQLVCCVVRTKLVKDRTVQRIVFLISVDDLTVAQYNDGISKGFNRSLIRIEEPYMSSTNTTLTQYIVILVITDIDHQPLNNPENTPSYQSMRVPQKSSPTLGDIGNSMAPRRRLSDHCLSPHQHRPRSNYL